MDAKSKCITLSALLAAIFSPFAVGAQAADIKVMSDSPLQPALTKVVDLYRQQTHNQVSLVFDPSPAVKKRIESGEAGDVAIVQPDFA
jgi:molybdate transport system substrate-binding protein